MDAEGSSVSKSFCHCWSPRSNHSSVVVGGISVGHFIASKTSDRCKLHREHSCSGRQQAVFKWPVCTVYVIVLSVEGESRTTHYVLRSSKIEYQLNALHVWLKMGT